MLIVKLQGGMGNQMFQYAFGRYLSLKNHCQLKFDVSFFETQSLRHYALGGFRIAGSFATAAECAAVKNRDQLFLNRLKRKLWPAQSATITEKSLAFYPEYIHISPPAYLDGYWQSERYFRTIESQLRQDFDLNFELSPGSDLLLRDIRAQHSVSLHIRRGDFASDVQVNKIHGTCSIDYYADAIALIADRVSNPVLYIFSDDVEWVSNNFKPGLSYVIVDPSNHNDCEALKLMRHCKHHIIANSTFSWWGAWLNPDPGKIVIAPQQWFNDPELNRDSATIVPKSWIRI